MLPQHKYSYYIYNKFGNIVNNRQIEYQFQLKLETFDLKLHFKNIKKINIIVFYNDILIY